MVVVVTPGHREGGGAVFLAVAHPVLSGGALRRTNGACLFGFIHTSVASPMWPPNSNWSTENFSEFCSLCELAFSDAVFVDPSSYHAGVYINQTFAIISDESFTSLWEKFGPHLFAELQGFLPC